MKGRMYWKGIIGVGLVALFAQTAWSYEEIKVTNGGTIKGTVTIEGGQPRPMAFNLVTIPDPVFCGTISTGTGWRIVEDFIIGPKKHPQRCGRDAQECHQRKIVYIAEGQD